MSHQEERATLWLWSGSFLLRGTSKRDDKHRDPGGVDGGGVDGGGVDGTDGTVNVKDRR